MINSLKDIIKSIGIVFGDIGTSPIYTLTVTFALIPATQENVFGVLSLIVWTLILLVSVQYAWLAMSLSAKGEGGTIVLREIITPLLKSNKLANFVKFLTFLGISFFIGDGVITPAISVLSAVEGLELIPQLVGILSQKIIIFISCIVAIILFVFQKRGTEGISMAFGPIMLIWFSFLTVSGLLYIVQYPFIITAVSPIYAIAFLFKNKITGFLLLSKVILCATGGEALYADMGHLGRKPIVSAWILVFITLVIVYLGQGAFLLENPLSQNIFYEMIFKQFSAIYILLLILSIMATVIASQAMISGIFSIVYQAITTRIIPRLHVEYTSRVLRSQIYIPFINWFLMTLVLAAIIKFKYSYFIANAYGLAASGTMTITAILITWIFALKKDYLKSLIGVFITFVNFMFLISNTYKIPYGGYWSLIIASLPLSLILIYTYGQRKLYKSLKPLKLDYFLEKYNLIKQKINPIKGQAIFLTKDLERIPTYIAHTMFTNNIIYTENILVSVTTQEGPFGIDGKFGPDLAQGLKVFQIKVGYMEILNLEKMLTSYDIYPKVIFYGIETIAAKNIIWKIYKLIKRNTPSFVDFYKLPKNKLHGVSVSIEI